MKITVTEERECCQIVDLIRYRGLPPADYANSGESFKFCRHCGQLWVSHRFTDAAGDRDTEFVKLQILTTKAT